MFGLSWAEILLIATVGLIVIGPKELPGVLRELGRAARKFRRLTDEFKGAFNELLRESEVDEIRRMSLSSRIDFSKPLESSLGASAGTDRLAAAARLQAEGGEDAPPSQQLPALAPLTPEARAAPPGRDDESGES